MSSKEPEEQIGNNGEENEQEKEEKREGCFALNRVYLVSKVFYFFFFAAQGSLLPYLALFFKQLELPANQIGTITGMKPYIAFFFIPFWGCVADRFKKGKLLFVVSMIAVVVGMVAYALVPINICDAEATTVSGRAILDKSTGPFHLRDIRHTAREESLTLTQKSSRDYMMETEDLANSTVLDKISSHLSDLINKISPIQTTDFSGLRFSIRSDGIAKFGQDNLTSLDEVSEMADESLEETPWSQADMIALEDQKRKTSRKNTFVFLYLLFATILSTILSCPSLTLADTATVNLLKRNKETHKYGKQRLWGSIGYGSMAFLIGAAVSRTHLCPPGSARRKDVNYYPCFAMYVIFNIVALVIGTRFDFNNKQNLEKGHHDKGAASKDDETSQTEEETKTNSKEIIAGLKLLTQPKHAMFFMTAFFVGITMGFIRVFLFWHLKDLGGTQILFSIMTAVNCVAEVTLYFLSTKLISYIGTIRVLYLGLTCYSIRLFFYAFVTNPWTVLPIELLSGITTAAVWAAMMSYVGTHSLEGASVTLQGILHGAHWGLGHGSGELIGGFLISTFGASTTFAVFGASCLVVMGAYILVNNLTNNSDHNGISKET